MIDADCPLDSKMKKNRVAIKGVSYAQISEKFRHLRIILL
jgi:hypothetical protein